MPFVTIEIFEGRSKEKKAKLHQEVTEAIARTLDVPLERVTIRIVDLKKENVSIGGHQAE